MFEKKDRRPFGDLIPGMDCKDFKPRMFHKHICKHSDRCEYRKQGFYSVGRFSEHCTGIKEKRHWDYVISEFNKKRRKENERI